MFTTEIKKGENTIGIKELQLNLKRVADAALNGVSFLVMRDSKPVFRIEPIKKRERRGTLEDMLKAVSFSHPDKNLSKKIDEIVYGSDY